jgi:hypothetical protein
VPQPSENKGHVLDFALADDLIRRLDDFRFKYRFRSRVATLKYPLSWALDQKLKPRPEDIEKEMIVLPTLYAVAQPDRDTGPQLVLQARHIEHFQSAVFGDGQKYFLARSLGVRKTL